MLSEFAQILLKDLPVVTNMIFPDSCQNSLEAVLENWQIGCYFHHHQQTVHLLFTYLIKCTCAHSEHFKDSANTIFLIFQKCARFCKMYTFFEIKICSCIKFIRFVQSTFEGKPMILGEMLSTSTTIYTTTSSTITSVVLEPQ